MEEKSDLPPESKVVATEEPSPEVPPASEDKVAAILAYVPFLCFYALFAKKEDPYAYHHGKQGLVLFIAELLAVALRWDVLWNVVLICLGALAVWAMVAALRGEMFRLPIISDLLDQY